MTTLAPIIPNTTPTHPKGQGYGVLIDELWLRLAPNQEQGVRFYTKDSLAQRTDTAGSTYENVLDIGYSWARGDVSGGEGLDFDPRFISQLEDQGARDKIRYWDSNNIDIGRPVRGTVARARLSRAMEVWRTQVGLEDLATSDDYLFIAHGPTLEWWDGWVTETGAQQTAAEGAINTVSGLDIRQIEASGLGDVVAVLPNNAVEFFNNTTKVFTEVPDLINVKTVWFVKGRFVAYTNDGSDNATLVEFDQDGPVSTGPFDTFKGECFSMVSSGPAVVAAISDGTLRSYVPEQSNQIDASSVTLVIQGVTETPEGEVPYLLGSNADILLVLTRTSGDETTNDIRLYQAAVLDSRFSYVVGSMQLRREWADINALPDTRKNMATTRDEVWFIVRESTTTKSIWRFDLVTLGLSRHNTEDITNNVHSIVIFDGRGAFVEEENIWRTSDEFKSSGYIISPIINFGLNTDINWVQAVIDAANLTTSSRQVELYYSTDQDAITDPDHPSWGSPFLRASSPPQEKISEYLQGVTSRSIALKLVLYSSEANSNSPTVTNWAIRGLPAHRDWILELPVNVSDVVEVPGRRPIRIPGFADALHARVLGLVGKSIKATVLDPPLLFRGVVDNIVEPTTYISDRGGVSVRAIIQLRGDRFTQTLNPIGNAGLGMGLLGVVKLGIGQSQST